MEDNVVTVDGPTLQGSLYEFLDDLQSSMLMYSNLTGDQAASVIRDDLIDLLAEFE